MSSNVCGCEPGKTVRPEYVDVDGFDVPARCVTDLCWGNESCGGRGECIDPLSGECDCDDPFVAWGNAVCDCPYDEAYDHETDECVDDLCMDNTCSGRGHCIDAVTGVCECYDGYESLEPGVCGEYKSQLHFCSAF